MMGTKVRSFAPLCNRSLEDLVPASNFYRHLEAKLDLGFVRDLVRTTYKECGRPSVDPRVFFKLQLVMFFEGIRSERELVRVAADRLSVRWYLGYDLDEELPDHSSLTRIRKRYGLAIFCRFFEAIVEQCREAGLVWGKELYFDATQVDANASLGSSAPRFAVGQGPAARPADRRAPSDAPVHRSLARRSVVPRALVEEAIQVVSGADQRQMAERLRKVAERLARRRDLLGKQAQRIGVGQHFLEDQPRVADLARPRQRLDEPESAHREGSLATE